VAFWKAGLSEYENLIEECKGSLSNKEISDVCKYRLSDQMHSRYGAFS
jgi:hypothetical protein